MSASFLLYKSKELTLDFGWTDMGTIRFIGQEQTMGSMFAPVIILKMDVLMQTI